MNIGGNNCTKSFQGPCTVCTCLQLGTKFADGCPAGWEPGGSGSGGCRLCSSAVEQGTPPAQCPSGLLLCRDGWPGAISSPAPFLQQFPPEACLGTSLAELFLFGCSLSRVSAGPGRVSVPMAAPGDLTYPWWKWAGAWGWRAEHPAAKLAQLWKTTPCFLEMASPCFIAAVWSCAVVAPCSGERRCRWQLRVQQAWGKQRGAGGCSWAGQLFRGTASAGEGQGTTPRAASSLASPIQDRLVLLRQCLMYFLLLFYLVIEIVSN